MLPIVCCRTRNRVSGYWRWSVGGNGRFVKLERLERIVRGAGESSRGEGARKKRVTRRKKAQRRPSPDSKVQVRTPGSGRLTVSGVGGMAVKNCGLIYLNWV